MFLLLLVAPTVVLGYGTGPPPDCDLQSPVGHGATESADPFPATISVDPISEKGKFALIQRDETLHGDDAALAATWYRVSVNATVGENGKPAKLRGILLRPKKNSIARLVQWSRKLFKDLEENGRCVAHRSRRPKRRMVFHFAVPAGAKEPNFEMILVGKNSRQWWKFAQG